MKEFDPGECRLHRLGHRPRAPARDRHRRVTSVHFLGERAAFVGAEENVTLVDADGEISRSAVHGGGILCAASDGNRIVMGGDDGKLVALDGKGEVTLLATDAKRRWIDNVARPSRRRLRVVGRQDRLCPQRQGRRKILRSAVDRRRPGVRAERPAARDRALQRRDAVVSQHGRQAELLEWAGSHLGVTFSPDNKFLVTTMHEPALHGWRLADTRHMRMTGYPGRVRSMSWSAGGKGLATSGADTVIVWPFASKDGPMGKEPAMLAPLQARVTAVACHPKQDILAAGYSDGTVLMVRLDDGAEILVRKNGGAPVAALAWNAKGTLLAFAAEDGDAGLLEFVRDRRDSLGAGAEIPCDISDSRFFRHAGQPGRALPALRDRLVAQLEAAHYPVADMNVVEIGDGQLEIVATPVLPLSIPTELNAVAVDQQKQSGVRHATWEVSTTD